MAKTLTQLLEDSRRHLGETDTTNTHFSDTILTGWLNEAYREAVSVLRHLPMTTTDYSVTGAEQALSANTVTVDHAKLLNPDSGRYDRLTVIKFDELMEMDQDFENADATFPSHLVRTGFSTARLHPPPSAAVIAQTTPLRTHGLHVPSDLALASDTPDLPAQIQDALAHWPAYRGFSELENAGKATEHLTLWRSRVKAGKGIGLEFNKKLKRFRWAGPLA